MIVEFDRELMDVLPRYIKGRQEDLGYLQLALGRQDFDAIRRIGKRVGVSATGFGLQDLGAFATALATHAEERQFEECEALIAKIRDFLGNVRPKFI